MQKGYLDSNFSQAAVIEKNIRFLKNFPKFHIFMKIMFLSIIGIF